MSIDSQIHPTASGAVGHLSHTNMLTLAALGVVFGDIGTSPLYAFKQCFTSAQGVALNRENVLGILSLIVWSLIIVVSIKYVIVILRADNRGEGGVLALSKLVETATRNWKLWTPISVIGILGAAFFLGDGMLTPAISVLSAVEGVIVVAPKLESLVIPSTLGILTVLFAVQRSGTEKVGRMFGPIIILWFMVLATLGVAQIVKVPEVLLALNPLFAIKLFINNGWQGFLVLSAVFLCVTGAEALYADIGHFGRVPISNAWFRLVLPALTLNYFGQGALVLQHPEAIRNPFYLLAPAPLIVPLIILATAATIIASQAVISGVFSVTTQAMNLGYLPRLRVEQPSATSIGQVYVPTANWIVFAGTALLVVVFSTSEAMASAYGIAVSITMVLASGLVLMTPQVITGFRRHLTLPLLSVLSLVDLAFMCSNITRVFERGWVPIAIAGVIFFITSTWNQGRRLLNWTLNQQQMGIDEFLRTLAAKKIDKGPGTAVYLTNEASAVPLSLIQQLKFQAFLNERVIILTFVRAEVPRLSNDERIHCDFLAEGIIKVTARYGFMERPDTLNALRTAERDGVRFDPSNTFYVVGRTTPLITRRPGLATWRKRLYGLMARNTRVGYEYFGVPPHRLLEIGNSVEL